ncbi:unnamed protein product [Caenorhabditis sp. 36 PRJEB53466]|nr:unnamed protein product [Caenorhabditis sp. 36 PRJEB53466]
MNPDSFCTDYSNTSKQDQEPSGRRLSTSWDNENKISALAVPHVEQRRNSNTLAQLLEYRQLSLTDDVSLDLESSHSSRPASRRGSIVLRRASVGSRRQSVVEMLVDSGLPKTNNDCVMVQQTLGTSTTLFFQKNPLVDNLDLRPSAAERGIFNFDDSIKEVPPMKYFGTPRPSIQLPQSPRPSTFAHPIQSIDESEDEGNQTPTLKNLTIRPSLEERGLPAVKFAPVVPVASGRVQTRGRTLHKQPRADPSFDLELDTIIASRRKIVDEEETKRERENQIRPRIQQENRSQSRPHHYDGHLPHQFGTFNVMEELRNQMESGEVDRIVKEKKTTTLSPTGVPVHNVNRNSITVEGSLPPLLDRPYVRAQEGKQGLTPDGKSPSKTVTIRVPEDHQNHPRGHMLHRSATPSPHNTADKRREGSTSP